MWILLYEQKSETSRGIYDVARVGRSRRRRVGLPGLFWHEVCSGFFKEFMNNSIQ